MNNTEYLEQIIEDLLIKMEENYVEFTNIYSTLPFDIYENIEKLAVSKSTKNKELCSKAKIASRAFHKKFK